MSAAPPVFPVLEVIDLSLSFATERGPLGVLDGVSFTVPPGRTVALVGESGCGKSVTSLAVMGLLPETARLNGTIRLEGREIAELPPEEKRRLRGGAMAMIFQEPMTSLNPAFTVGEQVAEALRQHRGMGRREAAAMAVRALHAVRIPDAARRAAQYPHQLSGGMRQRVMIAMALACQPRLLIADEPTTALDVTTQAQILSLIRDLQAKHGTAVLFITHDFGVVAEIADRIAVMRHGVVVEQGEAGDILNRPEHPYTRALIAAVPPLRPAAPEGPPLRAGPALMVRGVSKTYGKAGLFRRSRRIVKALDDVSVSLPKGGTLGIVGESGSGKSTLARCVVRLLDPDEGSIRLGGTDLAKLSAREMRAETKRIQMVFQDPFASLNPRRRVGELVAQGPMVHGTPRAEAMAHARDLFELVGLRPDAMDRFPHEFSGGQRQRIGLARALALRPEVLVADEAVSALDVSVQAQVLRLLADLRRRLGLSVLFITHDLRVAAQICDRIAVMHRGRVVEEGTAVQVFGDPQHDYTKSLLASVPGRGWTPPGDLAPVPEEIA